MPFDLTSSFADDYLVVDNIETVTLTTVRAAITTNTNCPNTPREEMSTGEIAASGGLYQVGDVIFNLAKTLLPVAPLEGDKITDTDSLPWHIIGGVKLDNYRLNYRCVCRKDR